MVVVGLHDKSFDPPQSLSPYAHAVVNSRMTAVGIRLRLWVLFWGVCVEKPLVSGFFPMLKRPQSLTLEQVANRLASKALLNALHYDPRLPGTVVNLKTFPHACGPTGVPGRGDGWYVRENWKVL